MRINTFICFLFLSHFTFAQLIEPDIINGVKIQPITHGSVVLETEDITVYIDPYGGAKKFSSLTSPDVIIITHAHGDHLNKETLEGINISKATFIIPQSVAEELDDNMKKNAIILNNGDTTHIKDIKITAFPMYNLPDDDTARHKKGWGNSYVLQLNNKNFYISGDTEDIPEMRSLQNIDVAFICMNLPFTMTEQQAASAVLEFKPHIVYPYHYRGRPAMSNTELFKKLVNEKDSSIEVRLRDWYVK
ncbi:MBL fold metallo-hydrolase [Abyssalbus ytuae]|uniref:MBL fold metallo-hydrolase n=1 Tax=Abyssalbus ytuae TaxID=2926907 RepID=A0A9E6ZN11_9FLAO|nr:MBL fold metallo-hydrolase [Abyssalbus ytuae]UOB17345.1 MBL fold metallo-hydrolase [Abyssalbus ytuae]